MQGASNRGFEAPTATSAFRPGQLGQATAAIVAEIPDLINCQGEAVTRLEDVVNRINGRLSIILSPKGPEVPPQKDVLETSRIVVTELGGNIAANTGRIISVYRLLQEIEKHLGI